MSSQVQLVEPSFTSQSQIPRPHPRLLSQPWDNTVRKSARTSWTPPGTCSRNRASTSYPTAPSPRPPAPPIILTSAAARVFSPP